LSDAVLSDAVVSDAVVLAAVMADAVVSAAGEPAIRFSADRDAPSARVRGVVVNRAASAASVAETGVRAAGPLDSERTRDLTDVVVRSAVAGVTDSIAAETAVGAAPVPAGEAAGVGEATEATDTAAARGTAGTLAALGKNPPNRSEIAVRTASSTDCRLLVMTVETDARRTAGNALVTAVI